MNDSIFFELEEEKKKILQMVEEKKISAEEADKLIGILEESVLKEEAKERRKDEYSDNASQQNGNSSFQRAQIPNVKGKIVVHVFEKGVKKVNIQLPIGLAKIADKFPIQTGNDSQIQIRDIFKTAKENGLDIDEGMYILVSDKEVHIYDSKGMEFVTVTDMEK